MVGWRIRGKREARKRKEADERREDGQAAAEGVEGKEKCGGAPVPCARAGVHVLRGVPSAQKKARLLQLFDKHLLQTLRQTKAFW